MPRTTPRLLPEQGFLRTCHLCYQGKKPENHFDLLPPEVLTRQRSLSEQAYKILPPTPIAAAYSSVPERLPHSARFIHLIFHLGEQFVELRNSDWPEEKAVCLNIELGSCQRQTRSDVREATPTWRVPHPKVRCRARTLVFIENYSTYWACWKSREGACGSSISAKRACRIDHVGLSARSRCLSDGSRAPVR